MEEQRKDISDSCRCSPPSSIKPRLLRLCERPGDPETLMINNKYLVQALYSRATGQVKNLGMMAFMMWMSGSQIHLFSIMMTASGIYQPIMSIVNSGEGMLFILVPDRM